MAHVIPSVRMDTITVSAATLAKPVVMCTVFNALLIQHVSYAPVALICSTHNV